MKTKNVENEEKNPESLCCKYSAACSLDCNPKLKKEEHQEGCDACS